MPGASPPLVSTPILFIFPLLLLHFNIFGAYQRHELEHFLKDATPGLFVCRPPMRALADELAAAAGVNHVLELDDAGHGSLIEAAAPHADDFATLPRDRWLEDYRKHGFSDAAARSYACMTQATIDTVEQAPEPDERGEVTLESYIQALVARGG